MNYIKNKELGQWRLAISTFSREIFALQRNMLQMRLVTISFRFRSRGTSRAADRRRPAFARAAHASNVEALKRYFYVGGYISKKTRTAKWGSGAIDALSNRLYISWMLEPCESRCPAEMEVVFRSETFAGDVVRVEAAAADGYTYHRVSAPDGKDHIVARTKG